MHAWHAGPGRLSGVAERERAKGARIQETERTLIGMDPLDYAWGWVFGRSRYPEKTQG